MALTKITDKQVTYKWARGNAEATAQDIMTVDAAGKVSVRLYSKN